MPNGQCAIYDLPPQNDLRGVQTMNANDRATFTIRPGCHAGRYPRFEVHCSLAPAVYAASGFGDNPRRRSRP